ncbi:hypothetical protein ACE0DR_16885 [Azotobacter sp. CWF10]
MRQLGGIGPVGLQSLGDQLAVQGLVAGVKAVEKGQQGGGDRQQQDQSAQIEVMHRVSGKNDHRQIPLSNAGGRQVPTLDP